MILEEYYLNSFLYDTWILYCSSSFFTNSSSALRCSISSYLLAGVSSIAKSLLSDLPEFNVLVSSKPKTTLFLYAVLNLKLAKSMCLILIMSRSNPSFSEIFLKVFIYLFLDKSCISNYVNIFYSSYDHSLFNILYKKILYR